MKSAQVSQNLFIYIFAILIIGLIFFFGYKKLISIKDTSNEVDIIKFKRSMQEVIASVGSGNVFIEDMEIPADFYKICFIDLEKPAEKEFKDIYPLIYDSWSSNIKKNVFLLRNNNLQSFYFDNIKIAEQDGITCFGKASTYLCCDSVNDKVKLRFSGRSAVTYIGDPTNGIQLIRK